MIGSDLKWVTLSPRHPMPGRVLLLLGFVLHLAGAFFLGGSSSGCFCPPPPQCPVVQNQCPPAPTCNITPQRCTPDLQSNGHHNGGGYFQGNAAGVNSQNTVYQQGAQPASFPITNSIYEPLPFAPPPVQIHQPPPVQTVSHPREGSFQNVVYRPEPLPIHSQSTNSLSEYGAPPRPPPQPNPSSNSVEAQEAEESDQYRTSIAPPPVDPPDSYRDKNSDSSNAVVDLEPTENTYVHHTTTETTRTHSPETTTSTVVSTTTTEEDIYDAQLPELPPEYVNSSENSSRLDDKLANDYSEFSFTQKHIKHRSKAAGVKAEIPTSKCSDTKLRQIMRMNMVPNASISKQLIFSAGRLAFGRNLDVVCARSRFSYTVLSSSIFCEVTIRPVTCFAFFQP
ncbi:hypothetical protein QR680_005755 [Steinernema hermaphroditum]|uniref:Ground-like domain-containing protein n=1 Tax=Steinernema hermaphroditum TaxID=289476 RepID=A0AA39HT76_9BILA|nr:hypothetical protein QR680_005755 [Steinernema hermaphroditum]